MTSHDARGGRLDEWATACENVQGVHARPPAFVDAGNDVVGLGRSLPWTFPRVTSFGQVGRTAPRRGRLEGCRDRERPPEPWSRPERQPSIAGQKTSPAGAPPTLRATDRAVGRSAYARPVGEPMPLLSSRQLRGRMRSAHSRRRQEIGYFSPIWHCCPSVHLVDRRPAREQVERRRWGRKPFPLQRTVASRRGKSVRFCGFGPGSKAGLIKAFPARSTTPRHNHQVR